MKVYDVLKYWNVYSESKPHDHTYCQNLIKLCTVFRLLYQDFTYHLECFISFSKCWKMNALFLILKLLRSWEKRKRVLEMTIFKVSSNLSKKMSCVERSVAKLNDEIQFLNDAIHVQVLNDPENEMLLINLYTNHLEELHKELQDKVFLFKQFCFSNNQISGLKTVILN